MSRYDDEDDDFDASHLEGTAPAEAAVMTFDELTLRRVWPEFVKSLHPTVLGRTSGALVAVERSLPELLRQLNKEGGQ